MIAGRSLFMRRIDFIMLEKNMKGKQIIENTRNDMRSFQKNEKCDFIYKDFANNVNSKFNGAKFD
jgi:hypothetical protein